MAHLSWSTSDVRFLIEQTSMMLSRLAEMRSRFSLDDRSIQSALTSRMMRSPPCYGAFLVRFFLGEGQDANVASANREHYKLFETT